MRYLSVMSLVALGLAGSSEATVSLTAVQNGTGYSISAISQSSGGYRSLSNNVFIAYWGDSGTHNFPDVPGSSLGNDPVVVNINSGGSWANSTPNIGALGRLSSSVDGFISVGPDPNNVRTVQIFLSARAITSIDPNSTDTHFLVYGAGAFAQFGLQLYASEPLPFVANVTAISTRLSGGNSGSAASGFGFSVIDYNNAEDSYTQAISAQALTGQDSDGVSISGTLPWGQVWLGGMVSASTSDLDGPNSSFAGIFATIVFDELAAGMVPSNPIMPTNTDTPFTFEHDVIAGDLLYFDPVVSIGYTYEILSGPNFDSVLLPVGLGTGAGNNEYQLNLWDGSDYVYYADLLGGLPFYFDSVGVDRFQVLGIDPTAGLDPNDPAAFVTGLSFVDSGRANFIMTPVTSGEGTVTGGGAVPEPNTVLMLATGIGAIALYRRRSLAT